MEMTQNVLTEDTVKLAQIAKLLSHPVRLHIVRSLSHMNTCCYSGDLHEQLSIARSTLSQHLKELKFGGIIQGEVEGPYIKYCLNRDTWNDIKELFRDLLNI